MINIKQTIKGINDAIESGKRDQSSVKKLPSNGDFYVEILDPDTNQIYTVTYY